VAHKGNRVSAIITPVLSERFSIPTMMTRSKSFGAGLILSCWAASPAALRRASLPGREPSRKRAKDLQNSIGKLGTNASVLSFKQKRHRRTEEEKPDLATREPRQVGPLPCCHCSVEPRFVCKACGKRGAAVRIFRRREWASPTEAALR
jgi:hypothetical protein